jgi:phosphomannomutase
LFASKRSTKQGVVLEGRTSQQGQQFDAMKKLASNIDFIKDDRVQIITIDGVRVDYPNGWGLVRPSNTTIGKNLLTSFVGFR